MSERSLATTVHSACLGKTYSYNCNQGLQVVRELGETGLQLREVRRKPITVILAIGPDCYLFACRQISSEAGAALQLG